MVVGFVENVSVAFKAAPALRGCIGQFLGAVVSVPLKVIVASVPLATVAVPVVRVISPEVFVLVASDIEHVAPVPAAAPTVHVGAEPTPKNWLVDIAGDPIPIAA